MLLAISVAPTTRASDAFEANAADLVRRAGGTPIRVASKSLRVRSLIERALATPGVAGVMPQRTCGYLDRVLGP